MLIYKGVNLAADQFTNFHQCDLMQQIHSARPNLCFASLGSILLLLNWCASVVKR